MLLTANMARNNNEEIDQKLSDLPIECIKRICSCLSFKDLVKACTTFSGWKYVPSLPKYKRLIANFLDTDIQWLDGRLCQLISNDSNQAQFSDALEAIRYYAAESEAIDCSKPRTQGVCFRAGRPFQKYDRIAKATPNSAGDANKASERSEQIKLAVLERVLRKFQEVFK
ncbi:hypothetical protein Aperf_G00000099152 [Anoplocephala perfoliata]